MKLLRILWSHCFFLMIHGVIIAATFDESQDTFEKKQLVEEAQSIDYAQEYCRVMNEPVDSLEKLANLFPKTVEQIQAWTDEAQKIAQQEVDAIIAVPSEERTFDNTVQALDRSKCKIYRLGGRDLLGIMELIGKTSTDKALRDAADAAKTVLDKFVVDVI